jgi:hypothetical protein
MSVRSGWTPPFGPAKASFKHPAKNPGRMMPNIVADHFATPLSEVEKLSHRRRRGFLRLNHARP